MSSPLLFDEDKQMKSLKTCLDCTPSKLDREQTHLHSNPESTFHYIKNIPQSSCPSCATSISRPGRCRPLFTIIPPMPQDSAKTVDSTMTTVTSPSSSPKAKIVVPKDEIKSSTTSGKQDASSKTKPDFVVRTNYHDSNAPLGVSVSKFNRNHLVTANQRLLIKGGRVVNDDGTTIADIFIEEGVIKQVGLNLIVPGGTKTIDAAGKLVMPGGIDTNTHLELNFMGTRTADDFYTGTRAALAGGTTTILDFVVPTNEQSLVEAYRQWRERADTKVCCDYGLHVTITHWNDQVAKEMEILTKEKGVNSFKVSMAYSDTCMLKDDELFHVFAKCRELGAIAMVHAENGSVIKELEKELSNMGITGPEGHLLSRPEKLEAEATNRAIMIAEQARCPLYVVNVMSKAAADKIQEARLKGQIVYGEPIAASLAADGSQYFHKNWRHAAAFVTSPPIRNDASTGPYLMDLLANGSLSATGTDHCAFNANQKALGKDDFRKIPNGVNGIEDRLSIVWTKGVETGKLDVNQFVAVTSSNAARIYNLYPKKGRIAVGSDGDCVIWDPNATKTISATSHTQVCDFNIFEGFQCRGLPIMTIVAGRVVYENGELSAGQGSGNYIETACFNDYIYQKLTKREQFFKQQKIEREPYSGEVIHSDQTVSSSGSSKINPKNHGKQQTNEPTISGFHNRPATRAGVRNLFDSSFTLSGAQWDDGDVVRKNTRIHQPPGGQSKGLW